MTIRPAERMDTLDVSQWLKTTDNKLSTKERLSKFFVCKSVVFVFENQWFILMFVGKKLFWNHFSMTSMPWLICHICVFNQNFKHYGFVKFWFVSLQVFLLFGDRIWFWTLLFWIPAICGTFCENLFHFFALKKPLITGPFLIILFLPNLWPSCRVFYVVHLRIVHSKISFNWMKSWLIHLWHLFVYKVHVKERLHWWFVIRCWPINIQVCVVWSPTCFFESSS